MTAAFPSALRVGYRDYRIEQWKPRDASARDAWGETCNSTAYIRVVESLIQEEPRKAANTLLHEVLHACWYVAALEDGDKQERTVLTLANVLSQVWRDNPGVIAYLDENLK